MVFEMDTEYTDSIRSMHDYARRGKGAFEESLGEGGGGGCWQNRVCTVLMANILGI